MHGELLVAVARTLLANAALLAIALNLRANLAGPSVAAALPCRFAVFSVANVVDVRSMRSACGMHDNKSLEMLVVVAL